MLGYVLPSRVPISKLYTILFGTVIVSCLLVVAHVILANVLQTIPWRCSVKPYLDAQMLCLIVGTCSCVLLLLPLHSNESLWLTSDSRVKLPYRSLHFEAIKYTNVTRVALCFVWYVERGREFGSAWNLNFVRYKTAQWFLLQLNGNGNERMTVHVRQLFCPFAWPNYLHFQYSNLFSIIIKLFVFENTRHFTAHGPHI